MISLISFGVNSCLLRGLRITPLLLAKALDSSSISKHTHLRLPKISPVVCLKQDHLT